MSKEVKKNALFRYFEGTFQEQMVNLLYGSIILPDKAMPIGSRIYGGQETQSDGTQGPLQLQLFSPLVGRNHEVLGTEFGNFSVQEVHPVLSVIFLVN